MKCKRRFRALRKMKTEVSNTDHMNADDYRASPQYKFHQVYNFSNSSAELLLLLMLIRVFVYSHQEGRIFGNVFAMGRRGSKRRYCSLRKTILV